MQGVYKRTLVAEKIELTDCRVLLLMFHQKNYYLCEAVSCKNKKRENKFTCEITNFKGFTVCRAWVTGWGDRWNRVKGTWPCVCLTLWPAPSDVHGPPTATSVLPLLAHECGTLCQPN